MPEVKLTPRVNGPYSRETQYQDSELQTGAILIDQDAYTPGLDRVYNVKGLRNMHVNIQNTGGANGLTYTIEKASKEFTDISTLVDADFSVVKADTNVAFGANDPSDIIDISPESSAIRIRVRRQTAGMDTTLAGVALTN